MEWAWEVHMPLYLIFVNYERTFDSIESNIVVND